MKKNVVFLRSHPIELVARVIKEADTLQRYGYNVTAVGWNRENKKMKCDQCLFKIVDIPVKGYYGIGIRNFMYILKWNIALFKWLSKNRKNYDIIHAYMFDTIIPAIITKYLYKKKIVYDISDFYADMIRNIPSFLRKVIRFFDCQCIRRVDAVIIPDVNRREQLKGCTCKWCEEIYNSIDLCTLGINNREELHRFLNTNYHKEKGQLHIAYVGLLQLERGFATMISVVKKHPEWILTLGGYGGDEEEIKKLAGNAPNIKFVGKLPYQEVLRLYQQNDLLFATYDPSIPNHKYSSPNKLFEAMLLQKPIVVAKGTGMDKLARNFESIFAVEYGNKKELEKVLEKVAGWNTEQVEKSTFKAFVEYSNFYSWDKMEEKLLRVYKRIDEQ